MIDLEAACQAARRYAQLIHHHDLYNKNINYGHKPQYAWYEFKRQFKRQFIRSGGVAVYTLVCYAFAIEFKRLAEEARARRPGDPGDP